MILSVVIPGDRTVNSISIKLDGMVYFLLTDMVLEADMADSTYRSMSADVVIYPDNTSEVFTIMADMPAGDGEEAAIKLLHLTL
jgi:hypothetical protein